jgi:hypothetical protein
MLIDKGVQNVAEGKPGKWKRPGQTGARIARENAFNQAERLLQLEAEVISRLVGLKAKDKWSRPTTMPAPPITSAGRFSPLGPRGIIFLLFICGAVLGFRGKFVEIGLISICLVLWTRDWNGSAGSVIDLHPSTFAPKQSHGHKFFSLLCAKHAGGALRWWVQIALKPASKTRRLHRVFIRGKGLEYVIADSAFKRMQIDTRAC